jgi:hypothetical protein
MVCAKSARHPTARWVFEQAQPIRQTPEDPNDDIKARMGALDEAKLAQLVEAGCTACGKPRLRFSAYLDGRLPLLGGEPVGKLVWCYDGEKFIDGVYDVRCAECEAPIFSAAICPRCHREEGLARALNSGNSFPLLSACPSCDGEEVRYIALVPATVLYERQRALPPRSETDPYDHGFHGFRIDCVDCGTVEERTDRCPLCDAAGPLRSRPG